MLQFVSRLLPAVLLASFSPVSLHAQAAPVSLSLIGQDGTAKTLSFADLQALPQIDIVTVNKDSSRTIGSWMAPGASRRDE